MSLFSLAAIWDKYLLYFIAVILKAIVKRVARYARDQERVKQWDEMMTKLARVIVALILNFVAFDVILFAGRALVHCNWKFVL